jgi:hypothetical protein
MSILYREQPLNRVMLVYSEGYSEDTALVQRDKSVYSVNFAQEACWILLIRFFSFYLHVRKAS